MEEFKLFRNVGVMVSLNDCLFTFTDIVFNILVTFDDIPAFSWKVFFKSSSIRKLNNSL